jgi:hypothetical protein
VPSRRAIEGLLAQLREETGALCAAISAEAESEDEDVDVMEDARKTFVSDAPALTPELVYGDFLRLSARADRTAPCTAAIGDLVAIREVVSYGWIAIVVFDRRATTTERVRDRLSHARADLATLLAGADDEDDPVAPPRRSYH